MKYTSVHHCLSFSLLHFVRDFQPTESQLLSWLGAAQQGRYHFLIKVGLLVLQKSNPTLSPPHLSADGRHFEWENMRYNIDEETIDTLQAEERNLPQSE